MSAAKVAQSLPELKRDGGNVLSSVWLENHFDKSSSSTASTVLPQSEFVPKLIAELRETPDQAIADFEELRRCCESHVCNQGVQVMFFVISDRSLWHPVFCDWQYP